MILPLVASSTAQTTHMNVSFETSAPGTSGHACPGP
jgi:hypothetical protein